MCLYSSKWYSKPRRELWRQLQKKRKKMIYSLRKSRRVKQSSDNPTTDVTDVNTVNSIKISLFVMNQVLVVSYLFKISIDAGQLSFLHLSNDSQQIVCIILSEWAIVTCIDTYISSDYLVHESVVRFLHIIDLDLLNNDGQHNIEWYETVI